MDQGLVLPAAWPELALVLGVLAYFDLRGRRRQVRLLGYEREPRPALLRAAVRRLAGQVLAVDRADVAEESPRARPPAAGASRRPDRSPAGLGWAP